MASCMGMCKLFAIGLVLLNQLPISIGANGNVFSEYIGALFKNVTFSDVPINPAVEFHFILAFAIDYSTESGSPVPTDGNFNIFWDTGNLSPEAVEAIKAQHTNVKIALSLGGDSINNQPAEFKPSSVSSWVDNAVSSLSKIIEDYHLDGIDIDYEHFQADNDTFAECIGQLITRLKQSNTISFASVAPFDDQEVQSHYLALWNKYGTAIDYVNFQFYAYDASTTVSEFIQYYNTQASQYKGGKVLVSFTTQSSGGGGLSPENGFFEACKMLKQNGELEGIFVWCADNSQSNGFKYETQSQDLLAS